MQFACLCLFVFLLAPTPWARGDALVVTRAMKASTIAEVFVEEDGVRVELEIGARDIAAFAGLVPDSMLRDLPENLPPESERRADFFATGWIVRADGVRLEGGVEHVETRQRVPRDEVTGEGLQVPESQIESVLFAVLTFPFANRPTTVSIRPPEAAGTRMTSANVGLMLYHVDVPVCDFRYLGREETVTLDWDDPFYSRFENRNLWRQFNSPISVFLYVDAFEVRKEVVARPKDLQAFVDLGLDGKTVITVEEQGSIKEKVAAFLAARGKVLIDGEAIGPILDRIHFIERTLRTTGVVAPPRDISLNAANLGVIFAYPVERLPQEVTLEWDLFSDRVQRVPSAATDEAGGLPSTLTPEDPVLTWTNFLKHPTSGALEVIRPPARPGGIPLPSIVLFLLATALLGRVVLKRHHPGAVGAFALALLLVAGVLVLPYGRVGRSGVRPDEASTLVQGLLRNVYRAFDRRGEEAVYDTLEQSVSGDLLERVYLETRRSLELANQGGARAKVKTVDLDAIEVDPTYGGEGFRAKGTWDVLGSIGHWGHIHQRQNRYEATLEVRPVEGVWKITELDVSSEERR